MPTMDGQPPGVGDPLDTRTTALRGAVCLEIAEFGPIDANGVPEIDAALDALTEHHEAIGAVKALEHADQVWSRYLCACAGHVNCRWHDELAAWRERRRMHDHRDD